MQRKERSQSVEDARRYLAARDRCRRQQREVSRLLLYERVRDARRQTAPSHPSIQSVYLYGSLVRPGRFGSSSDVDVAVDCDDPSEESRFWHALESALQMDVDLRRRQGAIAQAVSAYGEQVYEREIHSTGADRPQRHRCD